MSKSLTSLDTFGQTFALPRRRFIALSSEDLFELGEDETTVTSATLPPKLLIRCIV